MLVFSCFLFCLPVFPIAVFGQSRCDRDAKSLFLTPRPGTLCNRVLGTQASERLDLCLQRPKFSWLIPTVLLHAQRFSVDFQLCCVLFSQLCIQEFPKHAAHVRNQLNFRLSEYHFTLRVFRLHCFRSWRELDCFFSQRFPREKNRL